MPCPIHVLCMSWHCLGDQALDSPLDSFVGKKQSCYCIKSVNTQAMGDGCEYIVLLTFNPRMRRWRDKTSQVDSSNVKVIRIFIYLQTCTKRCNFVAYFILF